MPIVPPDFVRCKLQLLGPPDVHLFGIQWSPPTRKVLFQLRLRRIPFRFHECGLTEARGNFFLGINPRGLFPALVVRHDGRRDGETTVVVEATDIMLYVERVFGRTSVRVGPGDPFDVFEYFAANEPWEKSPRRRPKSKRTGVGEERISSKRAEKLSLPPINGPSGSSSLGGEKTPKSNSVSPSSSRRQRSTRAVPLSSSPSDARRSRRKLLTSPTRAIVSDDRTSQDTHGHVSDKNIRTIEAKRREFLRYWKLHFSLQPGPGILHVLDVNAAGIRSSDSQFEGEAYSPARVLRPGFTTGEAMVLEKLLGGGGGKFEFRAQLTCDLDEMEIDECVLQELQLMGGAEGRERQSKPETKHGGEGADGFGEMDAFRFASAPFPLSGLDHTVATVPLHDTIDFLTNANQFDSQDGTQRTNLTGSLVTGSSSMHIVDSPPVAPLPSFLGGPPPRTGGTADDPPVSGTFLFGRHADATGSGFGTTIATTTTTSSWADIEDEDTSEPLLQLEVPPQAAKHVLRNMGGAVPDAIRLAADRHREFLALECSLADSLQTLALSLSLRPGSMKTFLESTLRSFEREEDFLVRFEEAVLLEGKDRKVSNRPDGGAVSKMNQADEDEWHRRHGRNPFEERLKKLNKAWAEKLRSERNRRPAAGVPAAKDGLFKSSSSSTITNTASPSRDRALAIVQKRKFFYQNLKNQVHLVHGLPENIIHAHRDRVFEVLRPVELEYRARFHRDALQLSLPNRNRKKLFLAPVNKLTFRAVGEASRYNRSGSSDSIIPLQPERLKNYDVDDFTRGWSPPPERGETLIHSPESMNRDASLKAWAEPKHRSFRARAYSPAFEIQNDPDARVKKIADEEAACFLFGAVTLADIGFWSLVELLANLGMRGLLEEELPYCWGTYLRMEEKFLLLRRCEGERGEEEGEFSVRTGSCGEEQGDNFG